MTTYPDRFTPEVLEQIIHKAIKERDFKTVGHAMRVLAVRDPKRAGVLMTVIQAGLAIAKDRAERLDPPS